MNQRIARKLDFSRKLLLSIAGVLAFALPITFGLVNAPRVRAQEQAENANSTTPVYTVSIKPSEVSTPTYAGTRTHMVKMMYSPDGFTAANAALQTIIQDAYGVQASQIVGAPDWLNTAAYDMEFKIDNSGAHALGLDQRMPRSQRVLQTILADRFKLKIHRESRELPSYALIVGEDGPKLQPAKGGDTYASVIKARDGQPMGPRRMMMQLGNGQVIGIGAQGTSMADLAQQLSQQLCVPVVDKTGLTGGYDFDLHWSPDASGPDKETDNNPTPSSAAHESSGTALLSAIQEQLGLKLEPQKSQMPILVIEHVEKVQTPPAS